MRPVAVAAALVAGVVLIGALIGVETVARRRPNATVPTNEEVKALILDTPDALPTAPEVEDSEGVASPALTH